MAQQLLRQTNSKLLSLYPSHSHTSAKFVLCHQTEISRQPLVCMSVWEKDRKSGYNFKRIKPKLKHVSDGQKTLDPEMEMWVQEKKQKFGGEPSILSAGQHEDCKCVWNFHGREKVDAWKVTADSDNKQGFSQANFVFSQNRTGLFYGHLSRQVPKDGVTKRAGYCSIRSPTKYPEDVHDWSSFTHLLLKIRGDGRTYMLVISMKRHFDVYWHDQYHYALFTQGGPYWQTAKVPFSKFYATSKGRIQDKQAPIQLDQVSHLGITLGDDNEGPFSLEIDSISLTYDENHEEQFAYE
ncbi:complex I intermediate-associated protein 30, mitochondrial-like [Babylonia areolata]|uniref:complex I intermediate-associated protein 30, mitochondrial-like n=1 Tax=Babylonia areolata TaxID=304850 RepID=UPI003FD2A396